MKIKDSVKQAMGILDLETLRKHQIQPIDRILDGRDTMLVCPTGSGKSAIFQIPALVMAHKQQAWTLVVEPTISLMHDQVQKLQSLGIQAEYLTNYNAPKHTQILSQLREGLIHLLYVTPERLESDFFRRSLYYSCPWLVVVDEAHCVLDWGYTFRRSYLQISGFIKSLKRRPVIAAMTATAPEQYRAEICTSLEMKKPEIFIHSLDRPNITLLKEDCSKLTIKQRLSRVNYNIKKYGQDGRIVVYCSTRKNVDMVTNYLSDRFPGEVVRCHAYMDSDKREKHEVRFTSGSKRIMVATTAFGMGVDVPDIRLVIHFDLPLSAIDYYQQIGRAGRDGQKSRAMLLYHPDDIDLNRYILNKEQCSEQVKEWLSSRLDEMVSIAQSDRCLMQQLLYALGEEHAATCRHCTNCQQNRRGLR